MSSTPSTEYRECKIWLTRGKFALVSAEDFESLAYYKWHCTSHGYAARRKEGKLVYMHREIMKPKEGKEVDHINGLGLDNRRFNLRVCNHRQNLRNQKISKRNKSGYKGVYWNKEKKKWTVQIKAVSETRHVGHFAELQDAVEARRKAELDYYGKFVRL